MTDDRGFTPLPENQEIHRTDSGNAQNLILVKGSALRYCKPRNTWYIWDKARWKSDETGRIYWLAMQTVHMMFHRAQSGEAAIDKAAARHAQDSESRRALYDMVKLAGSFPAIAIHPDKLDADLWQLNLQNGSLDLRTVKLHRHERRNLITKLAPVRYDPAAKCPLWNKFLARILADNGALIDFLKRAVGYSLTGDTSEHALFFLYGTGANGKTTFLRALQAVFGDYACQADPDLLLSTNNPQHTTNIARLEKARLTVCMEVEEGRSMRTSIMKQLTGGDKRTARRMHKDFHEYEPTDKIWLGANNKPRIRGQELAIWRRIKLIPFTVTIPEDEQDKHLVGKLIAEGPGILNWALEGCREWQDEGLKEPSDVKTATADYKSESDPLNEFLEDCCTINADSKDTSARLYEAYAAWALREGLKQRETLSHNAFSRRLASRFEREAKVAVRRDGTIKYQRGFSGVKVKGPEEQTQEQEGTATEYEQAEIPF